jgi:hypothetical protein
MKWLFLFYGLLEIWLIFFPFAKNVTLKVHFKFSILEFRLTKKLLYLGRVKLGNLIDVSKKRKNCVTLCDYLTENQKL